jgi:cyclopropane-fatty-acyl-phospholipid synthase
MKPSNSYKGVVEGLLSSADIQIDGSRPQDIHIRHEAFYKRFLRYGSLGLGESYMDAWWECERIDEMFFRLLEAMTYQRMKVMSLGFFAAVLKAKLLPEGSRSRSHLIGKRHYDIGNELYQLMLDKRMIYSCGYWKHAKNLDEAQEAKLELACRKLQLEPGMTVLDVGCGWGGFAKICRGKVSSQSNGYYHLKRAACASRTKLLWAAHSAKVSRL